jgi:hypothetical protein
MPVPDYAPGEDFFFCQPGHDGIDDFRARAFEFLFTPFVAHCIFLRCIERVRRPVNNVNHDQLAIQNLGPVGSVLQRAVAAITAVDAHKEYFVHLFPNLICMRKYTTSSGPLVAPFD